MKAVKTKYIKAYKIGLSALIITITLLNLTNQQATQKNRPFNKTYTLVIKNFSPLAKKVKDKKIFIQQVLGDTVYAHIDGLRIVYYSLAATKNKTNKKDTF